MRHLVALPITRVAYDQARALLDADDRGVDAYAPETLDLCRWIVDKYRPPIAAIRNNR